VKLVDHKEFQAGLRRLFSLFPPELLFNVQAFGYFFR